MPSCYDANTYSLYDVDPISASWPFSSTPGSLLPVLEGTPPPTYFLSSSLPFSSRYAAVTWPHEIFFTSVCSSRLLFNLPHLTNIAKSTGKIELQKKMCHHFLGGIWCVGVHDSQQLLGAFPLFSFHPMKTERKKNRETGNRN